MTYLMSLYQHKWLKKHSLSLGLGLYNDYLKLFASTSTAGEM